MPSSCVLALDLGTTAFKAAPATEDGLCGSVTVIPYSLQPNRNGSVTCDPETYTHAAVKALRRAARTAERNGLTVTGIGISSQAQTFVPVDAANNPTAHAIVWTDAKAYQEAADAGRHLPDFPRTSGFLKPSALQFLPKVKRFLNCGGRATRFLLLNEWVTLRLTGIAFGDECLQGMGGFYDISARRWNERAIRWAGITPDALAPLWRDLPGNGVSVAPSIARKLRLPAGVPVYSCGNDQSCSAIGGGAYSAGDVFANMGTALVVYAVTEMAPTPVCEDQIAGISPLPGRWFLLAVEPECGNVVEWLAALLRARRGVAGMVNEALQSPVFGGVRDHSGIRLRLHGGGRLDLLGLRVGTTAPELARAVLEHYSTRFGELLASVAPHTPSRIPVGGGLSRSTAWLAHLSQRYRLELAPTRTEHPGLIGIARVVAAVRRGS